METKETFKNLLNQYFSRITYVNDCFMLYKHITETKSTNIAEMNIAPAFFQLILSSLLHTVFIETANLFDMNSSKSLFRLINICRDNSSIFNTKKNSNDINCTDEYNVEKISTINVEKILNDCSFLLKNVSRELENLINQGNKFYAYLDELYKDNNEKLEKDFCITYGDIEKLFQISSKVCNKISIAFDESIHSVQSSNIFDIDKVFNRLQNL